MIHEEFPSSDELENLFVNNGEMSRVQAYLNRFNPIRTMKMERMEIRHSAILAWLMDPSETHGLADHFLKAFLGEALRGRSDLAGPTALEISRSDLRDAEVRCEWQNIDIFVFSPANGWAFIIENKYDSRQHEGQLAKYMAKVQAIYGPRSAGLLMRGVFLTLTDEEPADARYAPIRYSMVCTLLEQISGQERYLLSQEVMTFLAHYREVLEEATGMSKERQEMIQLARVLYRDHRKVLDFVMEHGAGSDFAVAARALLDAEPQQFSAYNIGDAQYVFGGLNNRTMSFLPIRWFETLTRYAAEWPLTGHWWMDRSLIVWLEVIDGKDGTKGQVRLQAEVGPIANQHDRSQLIEGIRAVGVSMGSKRIGFQKGAADAGRRYSKFLKNNSVPVDDIQDAEQLANAMIALLRKFQPEFDAIATKLPDLMQRSGIALSGKAASM